jgi:aspartate-semialdehyde dehydrogenase
MSGPSRKIPVGVLGATGAVGQRMVSLLARHPWFDLVELAASERSAGRTYGEAASWRLADPLSGAIARMRVRALDPGTGSFRARILFSALDADVAGEAESRLASAGHAVVSNSKNHRMAADVPLVIAEVNREHLALIPAQRRRLGSEGFIVTNPNCASTGLTMALAPIHERFGIASVVAATLQAVSGAGYPGLPSMDILDNAVPYISGEEEKIEREPRKMLGRLAAGEGRVDEAGIEIAAMVHRVPVVDGHLVSAFVTTRERADPAAILAAWREWSQARALDLPTAPAEPLLYFEASDRPQTRLDRERGGGMTTSIGRLRPVSGGALRFACVSHNTLRGAAGASVLNAELLVREKYVS